jgi:indolepyruvate decarboxylase
VTATIAQYLLNRLHEAGVRHVFGVPGDYILRFYKELESSPIEHVGTTREDTAAFAADAYARWNGIGAMAITYGVGALSVVNPVAGAFAESSPVVVISGAPGVREQREEPLLHHRFGPFRFQREIFERITCAVAVLDDPAIAFRQIDRALAAAKRYSKPVYIELPRDQVEVPGFFIPADAELDDASDLGSLGEAVEETWSLLARAESPVIVAGVELHRRGLQPMLNDLVERSGMPVASTLTGKSVFGERHPAYLGVYEGAMGSAHARERVEQSDLLLMLGVTLNDVDLGAYTAHLDAQRMVRVSQDEVTIQHHRYPRVLLKDYVAALTNRWASVERKTQIVQSVLADLKPAFPAATTRIRVERLMERLNRFLSPDMQVICDTGDCLFSAIELQVHENSGFIASAFYTTMGFAVPAALGAHIARPNLRPIVLVGDGAFQMTGTELATIAHRRLNAIVMVLNNRGYSTERFILDGPFNDITAWRFHRLGEVFGPLRGYQVATEEDLESALAEALAETAIPCLIEVMLEPDDASPAMQRLAERLGKVI